MRRLVVCLLLAAAVPLVAPSAGAAAAPRPIEYLAFEGGKDLRSGELDGVRVRRGRLVLSSPTSTRGTWTSPWVEPGFGLTSLVASWSAVTPGDSWVKVKVRGRSASAVSSWDVLARWAAGDRFVRRASVPRQGDDLATVDVDTWRVLSSAGLASYQLQVRLMRRAGSKGPSPAVDTVGAVASRLPSGTRPVSKPGPGRGIVLDVPRYSQMAHAGHSPEYGGGGEAWCSPTSTSMVLGYYDALPAPRDYAWVGTGHRDPWVDHAARMTFDSSYEGTGNWPFNTAYAARHAGHAFVTRLKSLREAERFIAAGIPVVASIAFGPGALDGAPISSTSGHLLVIVGFTEAGDVVVNDPAARTPNGVRRTYDRAQFESTWLPTTGGLAYLIHDDAHPLP